MRGPFRCVVIAGLVATGCGDDASTPPIDAATGGGFVIAWSAKPPVWPAQLDHDITLERAELAVDSLRILGDAAPGDPRTTSGEFTLRWDGEGEPAELELADAPGGLYSQLSLLVDGHVAGPSIEVRGHAIVDNVDREFTIADDSPFSVTLDLDTTLTPPETVHIALGLDFARAVEALDFTEFEEVGNRLQLSTVNPEMAVFRAKLAESIQASATRSSNAL
jgi:hypothetical protein